MHLIYDIDDKEFKNLLTQLLKIKSKSELHFGAKTTGSKLSVHPGFGFSVPLLDEVAASTQRFPHVDQRYMTHPSEENIARVLDFSNEVNRFILNFVSEKSLQEISFFGVILDYSGSIANHWIFTDFERRGNDFQLRKIPMYQSNSAISNAFQHGAKDTFYTPLSPAFAKPGSAPNVYNLVEAATAMRPAVSFDQLLSDIEFLESPFKSNIRSTDCISCHMVEGARGLRDLRASRDGADLLKAKRKSTEVHMLLSKFNVTLERQDEVMADHLLTKEIYMREFLGLASIAHEVFRDDYVFDPEHSLRLPRIDYIHRQFGYFFRWPMVSQRTVYEAATAAAIANAWTSPGGRFDLTE
jgi:hypothetical protein